MLNKKQLIKLLEQAVILLAATVLMDDGLFNKHFQKARRRVLVAFGKHSKRTTSKARLAKPKAKRKK